MKNVVIVAHKFLPQPDDELITYLNNKKYPVIGHIYHSFSDAPDRKSFFDLYKNGELVLSKVSSDYSFLPEPLLYLKELFFTLWWLKLLDISWDKYIGMDGLTTCFGLILRLFGKTNSVIYWAIDFVPEKRFGSKLKDFIYHKINTVGYKKADEMWDLSPRMKEARNKYLGLKNSDYKKIKVVPYGMWTDRIKAVPYDKCQKKTLVFMGHLLPKQGAQLIVKSLPKLKISNPGLKLKIIGTGSYKVDLENLVKELGLEKDCLFLGKIEKMEDMEKEIAKSAVALAPYIKELDTWTYYADPGKIKTYLACGVPVLLTNIPWNASLIEKAKCGMIIDENIEDLIKKVQKLLNPKTNELYRRNALSFAKSYDYNSIFSTLLK